METQDSRAHPLARRFRRRRRRAIVFEATLIVVMVATVWASSASGTWSWWYVLPILFVLLFGAVFHLYAVVAFDLDETDQPVTGRDADQFALWKLDGHERGE